MKYQDERIKGYFASPVRNVESGGVVLSVSKGWSNSDRNTERLPIYLVAVHVSGVDGGLCHSAAIVHDDSPLAKAIDDLLAAPETPVTAFVDPFNRVVRGVVNLMDPIQLVKDTYKAGIEAGKEITRSAIRDAIDLL